MFSNRSSTIKLLRVLIIIFGIITIGSYVIWRSFDYTRGPEIEIFEPLDYSSFATSTITINGRAKRINNLLLNGSDLTIDEEGNFSRVLTLFPGINILTFTAKDKFGREINSEIHVLGTIELPELPKTQFSTTTP